MGYIAFSLAIRDVLPFVILMKEIEFILKLQGDVLTVLCGIFEKPVTHVTVYKDNKGAIALVVSLQMRPRMKHIAIKYHHSQSFVANGGVKIMHFKNKEQIADIFTKPLDSKLFGYLHYNISGW